MHVRLLPQKWFSGKRLWLEDEVGVINSSKKKIILIIKNSRSGHIFPIWVVGFGALHLNLFTSPFRGHRWYLFNCCGWRISAETIKTWMIQDYFKILTQEYHSSNIILPSYWYFYKFMQDTLGLLGNGRQINLMLICVLLNVQVILSCSRIRWNVWRWWRHWHESMEPRLKFWAQ